MADRYWVAGTGNWSDATNHWATTSGGAPGAGNTPTTADNVFFDALSAAAGYTVTIAATANCANFTATDPLTFDLTLAGSSALNVYGNYSLYADMVYSYTGTLTFKATATGKTITTATKSLAHAVTFDGVGGGWTLQDNVTGPTAASITLTNGALDLNGKTVTCRNFLSSNSNTRTLTFGAGVFTFSGYAADDYPFDIRTATNLTLNQDTGTINFNGSNQFYFDPAGKTFYAITNGSNTNNTLDLQTNALTCTNLTVNNAGRKLLTLGANITCTGTFAASGSASQTRCYVLSTTAGTTRTITAATVTISNIFFRDITGAGAGTWSGTDVQVAPGCSGITASAAVTRYWIGGTGSWDTSGEWSASSGGAGGASVPGPNDTAIFDANSFSAGSLTCTISTIGVGGFTITGVTNSPTFTRSAMTLFPGFSFTPEFHGAISIDSSTKTSTSCALICRNDSATNCAIGSWSSTVTVGASAYNGNVIFNGAVTLASLITLTRGTLNTNGQAVSVTSFSSNNSITRTLTLGASTITCTSTGTVWNLATVTGLTFNANTSTISLTDASATGKTFAGGGLTYNAVSFDGTGTGVFTVSGSNTFTTWTLNTNALKNVRITAGTTQTIGSAAGLVWSGTAGNLHVIDTTSAGSAASVSIATGTVSIDYVSLKDSTATGGATFYAGANSTNVSGNTGWTFTGPVTFIPQVIMS